MVRLNSIFHHRTMLDTEEHDKTLGGNPFPIPHLQKEEAPKQPHDKADK